jgi:hypothetical protein
MSNAKVKTVMRTIVRMNQSPLNPKQWCLTLECGHYPGLSRGLDVRQAENSPNDQGQEQEKHRKPDEPLVLHRSGWPRSSVSGNPRP